MEPAWTELFELLEPIHDDVHLFARRIARSNAEGDDLFQEAVLRAVVKLPTLRDRARFRAWMYSVVVSIHRTRGRRAFWRRFVSSERAEDPVGDDGTRWADQHASAHRAAAALATLGAAQREAIVLFELHGYSLEEIAEIQRASLSSVKSRLMRGRERLRRYYAELSHDEPTNSNPIAEEACRG